MVYFKRIIGIGQEKSEGLSIGQKNIELVQETYKEGKDFPYDISRNILGPKIFRLGELELTPSLIQKSFFKS